MFIFECVIKCQVFKSNVCNSMKGKTFRFAYHLYAKVLNITG